MRTAPAAQATAALRADPVREPPPKSILSLPSILTDEVRTSRILTRPND